MSTSRLNLIITRLASMTSQSTLFGPSRRAHLQRTGANVVCVMIGDHTEPLMLQWLQSMTRFQGNLPPLLSLQPHVPISLGRLCQAANPTKSFVMGKIYNFLGQGGIPCISFWPFWEKLRGVVIGTAINSEDETQRFLTLIQSRDSPKRCQCWLYNQLRGWDLIIILSLSHLFNTSIHLMHLPPTVVF